MLRRVLHVLSDSERSGTSTAKIVASLHRHIPRSDFEISACFVGRHGPLVEDFAANKIPTRIISWKHPSRDFTGALRFAANAFASRFDLIHFHWGGPSLRRIGKTIGGAKAVLHLHSSIEENHPGRPVRIDTNNSDAVIAVSGAVAASSLHRITRVIYPGIELPSDSTRNEDHTLIGAALRLAPIKGVSHLLEAVAMLKKDFPSLRLEIAGDGPSRPVLEAEAETLGIGSDVNFQGWIDDLHECHSKWTMMIQPSLEDGLPLSVLEAMSAGVPVVASRIGGLPEIIEHGLTGMLVPPADPRALADAIAALLRDADLRKRFSTASTERARQHFSAQRMANETAELYRELLRD